MDRTFIFSQRLIFEFTGKYLKLLAHPPFSPPFCLDLDTNTRFHLLSPPCDVTFSFLLF